MCDRYNDRENPKTAIPRLEKTKAKKACSPCSSFLCTCDSNMRSNFWIETRKIERGIAEEPTVLVITCFMYENSVLAISLDGWRIGQ